MYFRDPGPSKEKLKTFKSKLLAVDSHIKNSQGLPDTVFMHPELLEQFYSQKPAYKITNKLRLKESKSVIFKELTNISFQFDSFELQGGKRFCIHLSPSKAILGVELIFDSQRKKYYEISKPQSIVIMELDWKKVCINVNAQKIFRLSMMKIQIDTVKTHIAKSESSVIGPQKKIVQKQLQEYIKANRNPQKIQQIIQKRKSKSTSRLSSYRSTHLTTSGGLSARGGSIMTFKSASTENFKPGFDLTLNLRKQKLAQTKRDFVSFQDSKKKYLKHLQKMSPLKSKQLKKFQGEYDEEKLKNVRIFAGLLYAAKFLNKMNLIEIQISKEKTKQIKSSLMCKKFFSNLEKANRMKLPYRNRNKVSTDLNIKALSCFLYEKNVQKAENRIFQCFHNILYKKQITAVCQRSEEYLNNVVIVQKFLRRKWQKYMDRFTVLAEIVKDRVFQNQREKIQCFRQYMNACKVHSQPLKYGFLIHHKEIDEILLKFRGDEEEFSKFFKTKK